MRIDLVTLKIFLTVIEERSLARAAERHFIATSAVSKRISDLEDTLGVTLLERLSIGVRPTPAGLRLLQHAKDMMLVMANMRADMSEFGEGSKGEIRVFANSTAIVGFLASTLRGFLERYPAVDVHLEEWSSPFIVKALRDGLTDLGVFWSGVATTGLTVHPYRTCRLVAVVPEHHPLASFEAIEFAQALDYDQIAFHEGSLIFRMLQSCAADLQRTLRIRLQVTSFDAMRTMVRHGIGMAIMTDVTLGQPQEHRGLRIVPLTDSWSKLDSLIGYRDFASLPRAAQNLLRALRTPGTDVPHVPPDH